MSRSIAGFLVTLFVAGCAGAPTPGTLEPGSELCYRFVENEAAEILDLPHGLLLAGDAPQGMAAPEDRRHAQTLRPDGGRSGIPFAVWRPLGGDSIQVDPAVTGRLQLRLHDEGERLTGIGRAIGDLVRPGQERREPVDGVVAERVACTPAP